MVKKIAVLAPDLSGGGGTRVYLLAQVLKKLNYEVTVYGCLFGENLYPLPPSDLKVQWVKGDNYPQFFGSIKQLLQYIEADLLYAIKPRPTSFGIALLKRLQSRKPLILDIDDWEMSWFGGEQWRYRPTPRQLARDILKRDGMLRIPGYPLYLQWMEELIPQADAITVNTQFLQNRFGGTYLPNGKDIHLFDPQKYDPQKSREKYGLANYRVLMFPGTARPHKGLEDVLVALEKLDRNDLKLVVVGGRDIKDNYIEQLMQQWSQWLIKLPQQPLENMPEMVAAAHIIVVPQRDTATAKAQFPIKLTDAMAMAKPILSTTVGDIPKILGDTGYLVTPNSSEKIADTIKWIFENLDLANIKGLQARKRCCLYFSTEAMAKILSQLTTQFL